MISGKTGSGKSTALIRMLKAYCDSGVFQKVILISPTAAYDAKYKMLPLTDVYEDYSDELLNDIMEEQKTDMEDYKQTEEDIKLYDKFMRGRRMTKKELLRLYTMLNPMTEEFEKPVQQFDKLPFTAVILDDLGGTTAFRNGNNALNSIVCKSRHYLTNFFVCAAPLPVSSCFKVAVLACYAVCHQRQKAFGRACERELFPFDPRRIR